MVTWRGENGHNAWPWRQGAEAEEGRDATRLPESNCGQKRTTQKGEVGVWVIGELPPYKVNETAVEEQGFP